MDDIKKHWEDVWTRKKSNQVSWYQQNPKTSIELILSTNPSKDTKIIDLVEVTLIWWKNYLN